MLMFYTLGMKEHRIDFSDEYIESAKQEYDRNGCIKFEEVISREEALALGVELQELIEDNDNNALWKGNFINNEERTKTKIFDLHDVHSHPEVSEALKRLRFDPRIMARFAFLLGGTVDTVVINHHDKGFVKPGVKGDTFGGTFPKHQDHPFFPHEDDRILAGILYLSDITEDMGPVKVYPGSHKDGLLEHQKVEGGEPHLLDTTPFTPDRAVTMIGRAGTLVVFNYNMVHESGFNISQNDRKSLLFQVRHVDNHPKIGPYYKVEPFEGEQLWPPN